MKSQCWIYRITMLVTGIALIVNVFSLVQSEFLYSHHQELQIDNANNVDVQLLNSFSLLARSSHALIAHVQLDFAKHFQESVL